MTRLFFLAVMLKLNFSLDQKSESSGLIIHRKASSFIHKNDSILPYKKLPSLYPPERKISFPMKSDVVSVLENHGNTRLLDKESESQTASMLAKFDTRQQHLPLIEV